MPENWNNILKYFNQYFILALYKLNLIEINSFFS
jgi:hypothetical protein